MTMNMKQNIKNINLTLFDDQVSRRFPKKIFTIESWHLRDYKILSWLGQWLFRIAPKVYTFDYHSAECCHKAARIYDACNNNCNGFADIVLSNFCDDISVDEKSEQQSSKTMEILLKQSKDLWNIRDFRTLNLLEKLVYCRQTFSTLATNCFQNCTISEGIENIHKELGLFWSTHNHQQNFMDFCCKYKSEVEESSHLIEKHWADAVMIGFILIFLGFVGKYVFRILDYFRDQRVRNRRTDKLRRRRSALFSEKNCELPGPGRCEWCQPDN